MKIIAWLAGIGTLLGGAVYMVVSLNRWEWNRALFFGLIVLIAEVGLATGLVLRRLARLEHNAQARRRPSGRPDPQRDPARRATGSRGCGSRPDSSTSSSPSWSAEACSSPGSPGSSIASPRRPPRPPARSVSPASWTRSATRRGTPARRRHGAGARSAGRRRRPDPPAAAARRTPVTKLSPARVALGLVGLADWCRRECWRSAKRRSPPTKQFRSKMELIVSAQHRRRRAGQTLAEMVEAQLLTCRLEVTPTWPARSRHSATAASAPYWHRRWTRPTAVSSEAASRTSLPTISRSTSSSSTKWADLFWPSSLTSRLLQSELTDPVQRIERSPADVLRLVVAVGAALALLLVEWLFGDTLVAFASDLLRGLDAVPQWIIDVVVIGTRILGRRRARRRAGVDAVPAAVADARHRRRWRCSLAALLFALLDER